MTRIIESVVPGGKRRPDQRIRRYLRSSGYVIEYPHGLFLIDGVEDFGVIAEAEGIGKKKPVKILLTHSHPDHFISDLPGLMETYPKSEVYVPDTGMFLKMQMGLRMAREDSESLLEDPERRALEPYAKIISPISEEQEKRVRPVEELESEHLKHRRVPGHSEDSVLYIFEDGDMKFVAVGDTFCSGYRSFILPLDKASIARIRAHLEMMHKDFGDGYIYGLGHWGLKGGPNAATELSYLIDRIGRCDPDELDGMDPLVSIAKYGIRLMDEL